MCRQILSYLSLFCRRKLPQLKFSCFSSTSVLFSHKSHNAQHEQADPHRLNFRSVFGCRTKLWLRAWHVLFEGEMSSATLTRAQSRCLLLPSLFCGRAAVLFFRGETSHKSSNFYTTSCWRKIVWLVWDYKRLLRSRLPARSLLGKQLWIWRKRWKQRWQFWRIQNHRRTVTSDHVRSLDDTKMIHDDD